MNLPILVILLTKKDWKVISILIVDPMKSLKRLELETP